MPALSNARHERFAQGLARGLSAGEAYVEAGYAPNDGNASRLKGNEKVQARLAELTEAGALRAEVTVERVLSELARIGFSDLRRAFDADGRLRRPEEWDDETAAAISSVEVVTRPAGGGEVEYVHKLKLWDKNSALEKLGKHLKMFVDRTAHENPDGSPLNPPLVQFIRDPD